MKPVVIHTRVVSSLLTWMYLATFFYDGEPFDYIFEVGEAFNEASAKALVKRHEYYQRAQNSFLREVPLGPEINDLELLAA